MYREIKKKVRTTLRYRLFFLISLPIITTLFFLILTTFYWTVNYTWQSTLNDVSEKLKVAENSISIMQEQHYTKMQSFAHSYRFRDRLYQQKQENLDDWFTTQESLNQFDFIRWVPIKDVENEMLFIRYSESHAFFDVLRTSQLSGLNPKLPNKSRILIHETNEYLTDAFVIRTVYPVRDDLGRLSGYLDGGILLNNSHSVVDGIRNLIYPYVQTDNSESGTVTIFLGDLRVSTNVMSKKDGERVLGTRVSEIVSKTVLEKGENFIDRAFVFDDWYISAYQPLYDYRNKIVGILYTGYGIWPFIGSYVLNIAEIALAILLILIVSGILVYRNASDLFYPINRISGTVQSIKGGVDARIGDLELDPEHELAELGNQFDSMLDLLNARKKEIQQAAEQLEFKVISRTASLNKKTLELEDHIKLLNETRDKLIQSEKLAALGKLTAGIAHEINNPITIILGNVELLKFDVKGSSPEMESELDKIIEQIDRITSITSSLLQYSRANNEPESLSSYSLTNIVKEAITLVRTGSHVKNINFVTHFADTGVIECDKNQMLQVFINIAVNAIQAMNGKGFLSIYTEDWIEGGTLVGSIAHFQDKGTGIAPEKIQRVFDPFFTTKADGTGLGLAVSHSLVTAIGGDIRIKSQPGLGTTFSVFIRKEALRTQAVSSTPD